VSLPLLRWHLHCRCEGTVETIALVPPKSLRWHHRPRHAGIFGASSQLSCVGVLRWRLHSRCKGAVEVVVLASSPSSCWHCHPSCQCMWPLNGREGPTLLHTCRQAASPPVLLPMHAASQLKRRTLPLLLPLFLPMCVASQWKRRTSSSVRA
jgi:hypothetical protein